MSVELTPRRTRGVRIPRFGPLFRIYTGLNLVFFRLFGRRVHVMGRPLLLLTTIGARSGVTRRSPLGWFPDGDDRWLIVASNAGQATHPAWCMNMAKHPDKVWAEVQGRRFKVQPESVRGGEREEAWRLPGTLPETPWETGTVTRAPRDGRP